MTRARRALLALLGAAGFGALVAPLQLGPLTAVQAVVLYGLFTGGALAVGALLYTLTGEW